MDESVFIRLYWQSHNFEFCLQYQNIVAQSVKMSVFHHDGMDHDTETVECKMNMAVSMLQLLLLDRIKFEQ